MLKFAAETAAQPWFRILCTVILWKILITVTGAAGRKSGKTLKLTFRKAAADVLITAGAAVIAVLQIPGAGTFAGYLAGCTGIAAAVLAVCFQESLSNPVHGAVIAESGQFAVGDTVEVQTPQGNVCGTIIGMQMRSVTVMDVVTSSLVYIPNAVMDRSIVKNYSTAEHMPNTYVIGVCTEYGTDTGKALKILDGAVSGTQGFLDTRTEEEKQKGVYASGARIAELGPYGIRLTAVVRTATREENFGACSEALGRTAELFGKNGIKIASCLPPHTAGKQN